MIFDADTHLAPAKESSISVTVEELIQRMDQAGVDKCLSWVHPPYIKTRLPEYNQYVAESMKKYPSRIYGFGWIDPQLGIDEAIELTKKSFEEYGFYGIKLNGSQNKFNMDDLDLVYPLIKIAAKYKKIVAFHSACDDVSHVHPYRLRKVIKDFPETKFLMIHMGGESFFDASDAAIEIAEECPNVTLVGSEIVKPSVVKAILKLGASRVTFGSDTPFGLMHPEVAAYKAMLEDMKLSSEDVEMIMYKNIASLINA